MNQPKENQEVISSWGGGISVCFSVCKYTDAAFQLVAFHILKKYLLVKQNDRGRERDISFHVLVHSQWLHWPEPQPEDKNVFHFGLPYWWQRPRAIFCFPRHSSGLVRSGLVDTQCSILIHDAGVSGRLHCSTCCPWISSNCRHLSLNLYTCLFALSRCRLMGYGGSKTACKQC